MRLNLFCCFKSPTTDDNSSNSSSPKPKPKRNPSFVNRPLPQEPILAGASVSVANVPVINIEEMAQFAEDSARYMFAFKNESAGPSLAPSQGPSGAPSPALSRAQYIDPADLDDVYVESQDAIIEARVKRMFNSMESLLEPSNLAQIDLTQPLYLSVIANDENPYAEAGDVPEGDYEEPDTRLGAQLAPIGASNPSLYLSMRDLSGETGTSLSREPKPRSQTTSETRISAAQFLGVPDDYGLGTGQFGDSSTSIG